MVGQYPWMSESKWGVIIPCNLDPDILEGKGQFASRVYLDSRLVEMAEAGAHFDGIALDSLGDQVYLVLYNPPGEAAGPPSRLTSPRSAGPAACPRRPRLARPSRSAAALSACLCSRKKR